MPLLECSSSVNYLLTCMQHSRNFVRSGFIPIHKNSHKLKDSVTAHSLTTESLQYTVRSICTACHSCSKNGSKECKRDLAYYCLMLL